MSPTENLSATFAIRMLWEIHHHSVAYRWNIIHWAVVAMLSWLSLSADSFESTASSV